MPCTWYLIHTASRFGAAFRFGRYYQWLLQQDFFPAYAMYSQLLRYYQGSIGEQRFVLKTPIHLLDLDVLRDHLRGAMIVQTYREPAECLPGDPRLTTAFHNGISKSTNTASVIQQTTKTALAMAQRSAGFADTESANRVFHTDYRNLISDTVATIASIHDNFDPEVSPSFEQALIKYVSNNPQHNMEK